MSGEHVLLIICLLPPEGEGRMRKGKIKTGVVGCGAIGAEVARYIVEELREFYTLVAVCDKDRYKAEKVAAGVSSSVRVLSIEEIVGACDLIVESASISAARDLIKKMRDKPKMLVVLSVGVFVKYPRIISYIDKKTLTVYVPSGAIAGVDGISSLSLEDVKSITLVTSKPPSSLTGVKFLERGNIDVSKVRRRMKVFEGNIKEAIKHFPKNINVAAIIFLASRFPQIKVVIRVDPSLKRNTHCIEVKARGGRLYVEVENFPSAFNPKTSRMAILSTKNLLRKIVSNIKIGS